MEYLSGYYRLHFKDLDAQGAFEAYASTFGNVDRQRDKIKRGAFTETLSESKGKVPFLMGHNTGRIIGFGTGAEEDDKGLKVWGEFTLDADEGRNAYAIARHSLKVKQPVKFSIGYGIRENGATIDEKNGIRVLTALDLYEYSMVAIPANPRAGLTELKSATEWTVREFEEHLRDVGFSDTAAKRIIAAGFNALGDRRDVDAGKAAWLAQFATVQSEVSREKFLKEFA